MPTQPAENSTLLDVAAAAGYLGVTEAFVRRLVLERRVRYFKVGKFVRFRAVDLEAFIEAGRQDPVEFGVHLPSPRHRGPELASVQRRSTARPGGASTMRRRNGDGP